MTARNLILVGLLELQHGDFLVASVRNDLPGHGRFAGIAARDKLLVVVVHREDGAEGDLLAHVALNPLNPNRVAGRNAVLLSPGLNDGKHRSSKASDKPRLYG